jgi:hypothetical protein
MARPAEHRPGQHQALDAWDDTPSLEDLAAEQGVVPLARFEDLIGDFWPEDEEVDDFIATVRPWRQQRATKDRR